MHTITGLFDSRAEAERCVETMVQQYGIDRDRVQVHAAGSENVTAGTTEPRSEDHHGFLASLRDLFLPDDDRATYAEGIRRGGIMVAVQAEAHQIDQVMDAFERNGAVDLDTREQEWRQGGWSGAEAGSAGFSTYGSDAVIGPSSDGSRTGLAATTTGSGAHLENEAATGRVAATGDEEVIPVVEERLRVGKREVGHGRVRIRSYVVETPVQEQVTLREEHVSVERRAVDRPVGEVPADAFRERVIEATETAEEAVVAKEARVVEELRIRKEAEERTETVSDTVRRTEVEVEDERIRTKGGTSTPQRNPER